MSLFVWINHHFHAGLIRGHLQRLSKIVHCGSVSEWYEWPGQANSHMPSVCSGSHELVRNIHHGQTAVSPLTDISLLNLQKSRVADLGIKGCFCAPCSLAQLSPRYNELKQPKRDFIHVPDVYIGHRERSQLRPDGDPGEKRYKPGHGVQTPSGHQTTTIPKLDRLLRKHKDSPMMIGNIIGGQLQRVAV